MSQNNTPSLVDMFMESVRTGSQYVSLKLDNNSLIKAAPKGQGDPVIVIPGFLTNDSLYTDLRSFLRKSGHDAYEWGGGVNRGFNPKAIKHAEKRLTDIYESHQGKKVSLVGHSLGGIFAREMARELPEMVDKVITLGSPFLAAKKPDAENLMVRKLYDLFNPDEQVLTNDVIVRRSAVPPPVPTTSVYTLKDGIVPWVYCLNPKAGKNERVENIEVNASHVSLAFNKYAYLVIADRLARHEEKWTPFDKSNYPGFKFPSRQAHEDYLPEHPGKVFGHGKKLIFK